MIAASSVQHLDLETMRGNGTEHPKASTSDVASVHWELYPLWRKATASPGPDQVLYERLQNTLPMLPEMDGHIPYSVAKPRVSLCDLTVRKGRLSVKVPATRKSAVVVSISCMRAGL